MKNLIVLLLAFCLSACASTDNNFESRNKNILTSKLGKKQKYITFANKKYYFKWASKGIAPKVNEYVLANESVESWSSLIGVRFYENAIQLKDVLPSYMSSIKSFLVARPDFIGRRMADPTKDVTLILILTPENKSYYEYDFHRFMVVDGGVKTYQFAVRFPKLTKQYVDIVLKNQNKWLRELWHLNIDVYDKLSQ